MSADSPLLVIVEDGAPEEDWHDGRDGGVTASEIRAVANGSRKRWRTLLDAKLNGSTFRGNAATRRGHEHEPEILAAAAALPGVVALAPSGALFGAHTNPLHRATPDGLGIHEQYGDFGAEVKNHDAGWTSTDIPAGHADQMQWGMHVTGFAWWLYAWRVDGVDGIQHRWVPRDDARIAQLVAQADAFIAWRAAGAPEIDDIPDEIDDHIAGYAEAQQAESTAKKAKELHGAAIKTWAGKLAAEPGEPLRKSGSRASVFFEPKPAVDELDEVAWAAAEPAMYEEWLALQARVLDTASAARLLYTRPKPVAAAFRITPNGARA